MKTYLGMLLWLVGLSTILAGCSGGQDYVGKSVVVFLDRSGSARSDAEVYERAFATIQRALRPGDRIVVANITAHSSQDFHAFLDMEIPDPMVGVNRLLEKERDYKQKVEAAESMIAAYRDSVAEGIATFLATPSNSPMTAIIEATHIARQIFVVDERRDVLVLLSDMVEESDTLDMTKKAYHDADVAELVSQLAERGLIPNLSGATVYVAGAHAGGEEKATKVAEFWREYFKAAECPLVDGRYARFLNSFLDTD